MLRKVVTFCVTRSGIIFFLGFLVFASGVYLLKTAKVDVFPEFAPVRVIIQTEAAGFSSERTELLVTKPIENSLLGLPGIKTVKSQSSPGLSVVTVTFQDNQNILLSRQLVSERLATLESKLPENVNFPKITPLTSSASSLLGIGFTSMTLNLMDQMDLVKQIVIPQLMATEGVADVHIFGGHQRERQINLKSDDFFNANLTLEEVASNLREQFRLRSSGFSENKNQRTEIFLNAQPTTIEQIESLSVGSIDNRPIKISDIGNVNDDHAPLISTARINDTEGIFIMVQSQPFIDSLKVTEDLEKKIRQLETTLNISGLSVHYGLFRPANFISEALSNIQKDILIGAFLVLIILFLFLYNTRCAIISAIAIPLSLLSSIIILVSQGVTLNIMVLGGLVIALGEVVDDAIIDTENIFRRLKENRERKIPINALTVIINASMEVRHSIIFATLIVIIAFTPLLFLPGIAGRLFEPLGLAYIYALGSSLVIALTITPALCAILLSQNKSLGHSDSPLIVFLKTKYLLILNKIQKQPRVIPFSVIFSIFLGLSIIPILKIEFIPELREGHYTMHMTAIPGTSHNEMNRIGEIITEKIRAIENVQSTVQWVGRAENGADTFGMNYSEIQIEVGPLSGTQQEVTLKKIKESVQNLEKDSTSLTIPGFTFGVHTFLAERIEETSTGYVADYIVEVVGLDLERINYDAKKIVQLLELIPGSTDVKMVTPTGLPQLKIVIDFDRLSSLGIKTDEINRTISTVFKGLNVGNIVVEENNIPVVITFEKELRDNIQKLLELPLRSSNGQAFLLGDVTNIFFDTGKSKILRSGGKRIQVITANVEDRDIFSFKKDVEEKLEQLTMSDDNYFLVKGSGNESAESIITLVKNGFFALVFVILILRISLNSTRNLLIVLVNLPFCLIGGVIAILLTGGWLSIGSLVGFVTLFGITIRNSIMLTSHYQHLVEKEKLSWGFTTAARGASERLPSILMTAIVTGLGLFPLIVGSGEPGREIEGPMASIIVGGLFTSTILNLLILPCLLGKYGKFSTQ